MNFLEKADSLLAGRSCAICDVEVRATDAVFFDVDGDDERVRVTVQHGWCHQAIWDAVQKATAKATADAYREASNIVRYNDKADALIALDMRASQAMRAKLAA